MYQYFETHTLFSLVAPAGNCSEAVTCALCAVNQGLFHRSEFADKHLNESQRVSAASLSVDHSALVLHPEARLYSSVPSVCRQSDKVPCPMYIYPKVPS
jgi:hypothetical protein